MDINWKRPFKLAFEIGMFSLGWLLIILVLSLATEWFLRKYNGML